MIPAFILGDDKTGLSSRAGLALFAMENDLVGLAGSEEITRSGDGSAGVRH